MSELVKKGTISYPVQDTQSISAFVQKDIYHPATHDWERPIANRFIFRLEPADSGEERTDVDGFQYRGS